MRRLLSYAGGLGVLVAHRPADPWLYRRRSGHGERIRRAAWACRRRRWWPRRIMLERDLALAEITGARLLVDQITCADALERLERARAGA